MADAVWPPEASADSVDTLLMACLAFLIGSFPTGVVLTRAVTGQDVRKLGSGNIGAANVARSAGLKVGLVVLVLDVLKGFVPMLVARNIGLDATPLALVAFAAVLGHDFSLFLRFRGGKGVATSLGVMLALAPLATLLALLVYLAVMLPSRYASLASLSALAALPVFVGVTHQPAAYTVLASALFVVSALKHWENIFHLVQGTERKFGRNAG